MPVERIRNRYQRAMALLPRILEEASQWFIFDNSATTPELVASFDGNTRTDHALSLFWDSHLIKPLEQREQDRWRPYPETFTPDEANGKYLGEITMVGAHYILQTIESRRIRHDRLLLRAELSEGQSVTIKYKDGLGEVL